MTKTSIDFHNKVTILRDFHTQSSLEGNQRTQIHPFFTSRCSDIGHCFSLKEVGVFIKTHSDTKT